MTMNFIYFKKNILLIFISIVTLVGCQTKTKQNKVAENNFTQFVDPFIGSGGHGHVFVGANVPFGIGHHHTIIPIL